MFYRYYLKSVIDIFEIGYRYFWNTDYCILRYIIVKIS